MKVERLAEHHLDALTLPPANMRTVCEHCGLWRDHERLDYDPPNAVLAITNGCCRCEHDSGGFGTIDYLDAHSEWIEP